MGWQRHIEPDNIMQFFVEGRLVGQFELPPSMWGEPMLGPNLLHRGNRDAGGFGQGASRPVRCFVGRPQPHHAHLDTLRGSGRSARCLTGQPGLVAEETVEANISSYITDRLARNLPNATVPARLRPRRCTIWLCCFTSCPARRPPLLPDARPQSGQQTDP